MKFTICVTQRCNLRCEYCYIDKDETTLDVPTASAIVDWIYTRAAGAADEKIDIGLFGGEPLLVFDVVRAVVELIEAHPAYERDRVILSVISNGTIFTPAIAEFLRAHGVRYALSFDGPPDVQNRFRRFASGRGSADLVERNARAALEAFGWIPVNAVLHPETFRRAPDTIRYLASLGLRQIYLTPDYSAPWTRQDVEALPAVCDAMAELYVDAHVRGTPLFLSPIDGKIAALLRGGYRADERCRMGTAEFAFSPLGQIYPCERLIGCGRTSRHSIGSVGTEVRATDDAAPRRPECDACPLADFCVHWCGCSNFFATGDYGRTSPVICAFERASIAAAARAFEVVEAQLGPTFVAHLTGHPSMVANGRY